MCSNKELKHETMSVAGVTIERTAKGKPTFVRIDLRKHADIIPVLEKKGVEVEKPIKWTAKMKKSLTQAKKGEVVSRSLEELFDVSKKDEKVEEPIKWTEKMKKSFAQAKNGEFTKGDINNFWGE